MSVRDGASTHDVAALIGPRLAAAAVGGQVERNGNDEIYDLRRPLPGDCTLRILTASDDDAESLKLLRHSTAHVMAEAICKLFPETKLVYGPPLDDGFYYDIDLDRSITPEDFERIETEMGRIVKEDRPFTRYDLPREQALAKLQSEGNRYKVDNAMRAEGDTLSFYVNGEPNRNWEDLCRGPHIPASGRIGAFKIRQVSGSHYHGDINEKALQRVYGTAFYKKRSLEEYVERLEEARKRDHRKLGPELGLFTIDPLVGTGLILWKPRGSVVRLALEQFIRGELIRRGYEPVYSPHIGRLELYRTSGHFPYYRDSQYPPLYESETARVLNELWVAIQEGDKAGAKDSFSTQARKLLEDLSSINPSIFADLNGDPSVVGGHRLKFAQGHTAHNLAVIRQYLQQSDGYLLKPMNCPHHIRIYASEPRSYRDLPVRLAEFGTVYRYEQSGEVGGLTRVRGLTQDDAHIFCTVDQLHDELADCVDMARTVLDVVGLSQYRVRASLRDDTDKYVGSRENWEKAEAAILDVVRGCGMDWFIARGEAAFYGPKIDFLVKDVIGREWQLGTVQCDYNLPERFDLHYTGPDNREHRPVMVHRAPLGSLERFIGILIEHFAGAFPLWLAPVQVAIATVSEKSDDYARQVYGKLKEAGFRTELDTRSEKIGPKKHALRARKIPYILVVGEQEAAGGTVNVNDRTGNTVGSFPLDQFIQNCQKEVAAQT